MKKVLQYLFRWSVNLILAAALLLAAAIWLPGLFHMKAYVVKSSSMEPAIMPGSVIYVSQYREGESVSPGDIVSFRTGDAKVTHRVVAVNSEYGTVTTKGDANQVCDSQPVTFDAIEGKVRFHIPAIGYLLLR
ncbi:MAG: signal peptidase I [Hungatella sp.]|jgi:signal peptidase|nr:signal peptidase I [Hungatella sp.]